jgi:hypothetical protein
MMTFEAARLVSRVEMAVLAMRVVEKKTGTVTPTKADEFSDAGVIPDWARASVAAAVAKEIVAGFPDDTFRAEAAEMVHRLLDTL